MELSEEISNSLESYYRALDRSDGRTAYRYRLHIEQHCVTWLTALIEICRAYERMNITADTAARIAASGGFPQFVYVCSPLRGNIRVNVAAARGYCAEVIKEGYIPIAPHVMFYGILDDNIPEQREKGLSIGKLLLPLCRELRIYGQRVSSGMLGEIKQAEELNIPVIDRRGGKLL